MENLNVPCKISCYDEEAQLGLRKAKVIIMHEGKNRNKTSFSKKSMSKAEESIKNRPLLAYIKTDKDGNAEDFTDHRKIIKKTKDGYSIYYLETPIGVFPESCNPRYEEIGGVSHFVADCYIWEGYSNEALDLIEESDGEKQVSMEIEVNESETLEDGVVDITDYRYMAVTVLGDDVIQGMNGTCGLELFSCDTYLEEFTKDITTKIQKIEKGESLMDKQIYGIGSKELVRLVSEALLTHTYVEKMWGDEYEFRRYRFIDLDSEESTTIAYDYQKGTVVGIPFTLDKDVITLDADKQSKYVAVWKKVEEGEEAPQIDFENQYTAICNEKIESLQEAYNKQAAEKDELKKEYDSIVEKHNALETEVTELKEFKETKEKEEKQMALEKEVADVVSEFDLELEELSDLTSKVYAEELTVEEFKKELLIFEGMKALEEKKKAKFSKKAKDDKESIAVKFNLEKDVEAEALERKRQAYGGIFKDQL